jgi:hypothetical protein
MIAATPTVVQDIVPKNAPLPADVLLTCLTPKMIERFWKKVQRCDHGYPCATCCWLWKAVTSRGYGALMCRYEGKPQTFRAHRISWTLRYGAIPNGLHVLHNCPTGDNPLCVNPEHLWLGGNKANQEDAKRKGRTATGDRNGHRVHPGSAAHGDRHSSRTRPDVPSNAAALVLSQVQDILYLVSQGMPDTLLGHIYNVDRSTIGLIRRGKTWQRVLANVEGARA